MALLSFLDIRRKDFLMPPSAARIEINELPPELAVADVVSGIGQIASSRHLHLVDSARAESLPRTPSPELTPRQFRVVSLLSMGKTLNQIRERVPGSRDDIVQVEEEAKAKLGVETPSAMINQAIVHGILPIELETNDELVSQITAPDRYTLRSYAAGVSIDRIARSLGMAVREFIKYEPVLQRKVGARKRPQSVRRGHELGILSR
jgi:DNA-binding CsgD family transcriptional regulator